MIGEADARQRVWDLPTRLFHWTLAGLIAFSWWSVTYHHIDWHIWSGIALLCLLLFRLMWGVVGSSTARFANFVRGPRAVRDFIHGEWAGTGHSPLGALSVIALLALVALQVGLGLIAVDEDGLNEGPLAHLVSIDTSDWARGVHGIVFYVLLAFIVCHIAAIFYYRLRGRKLTGAMIHGGGELDPDAEPMRPGKWWVALACLVIALVITRWVVAGAPPF